MKLVIVNGAGETLGEVKLSQELLRRPDILTDRLGRVIESSMRRREEAIAIQECRVVETLEEGLLESLDTDGSILDVPLKLSEACKFDFDKHINAITEQEDNARTEHQKYTKLNYAQENSKKYDTRYKERPANRIRYK